MKFVGITADYRQPSETANVDKTEYNLTVIMIVIEHILSINQSRCYWVG
jgi:hypothetical protein